MITLTKKASSKYFNGKRNQVTHFGGSTFRLNSFLPKIPTHSLTVPTGQIQLQNILLNESRRQEGKQHKPAGCIVSKTPFSHTFRATRALMEEILPPPAAPHTGGAECGKVLIEKIKTDACINEEQQECGLHEMPDKSERRFSSGADTGLSAVECPYKNSFLLTRCLKNPRCKEAAPFITPHCNTKKKPIEVCEKLHTLGRKKYVNLFSIFAAGHRKGAKRLLFHKTRSLFVKMDKNCGRDWFVEISP